MAAPLALSKSAAWEISPGMHTLFIGSLILWSWPHALFKMRPSMQTLIAAESKTFTLGGLQVKFAFVCRSMWSTTQPALVQLEYIPSGSDGLLYQHTA